MTALFDRLVHAFGAEAIDRWHDTPRVAPDSIDMAREVMQFAAQERLKVLPAGACEHLPPESHADLVISTRRLTRIHEYEPEEMVIVAEAGLTLHTLADLTAPHRQRLGPSPWPGHSATLGGAVAAARANLDRRGRGAMRDVVLGARVLHADGRTSKTGGKVVKNVTGYDLSKLYTGSHGALGILIELNLRLVPMPEATCVMAATVSAASANEHLLALHRAPLAPVALLLVVGDIAPWSGDHVYVVARFEGSEAGVAWQRNEAARIVPGMKVVDDPQAWGALQQMVEPRGDVVLLQVTSLPVSGPLLLEILNHLEPRLHFVAQFGVGVAHARLPLPAVDEDLEAFEDLVGALARFGLVARALDAPPGLAARMRPTMWDPSALRLMQSIKQSLDPEACFPAVPDLETKQ